MTSVKATSRVSEPAIPTAGQVPASGSTPAREWHEKEPVTVVGAATHEGVGKHRRARTPSPSTVEAPATGNPRGDELVERAGRPDAEQHA